MRLRRFWKKHFLKILFFIVLIAIIYFKGYGHNFLQTAQDNVVETFLKAKLLQAEMRIRNLTSIMKRKGIWEGDYDSHKLPTIFVITPTHSRLVQKAELTRLKNVFMHVPALHWIVIEDSAVPTELVSKFLSSSKIPFTHLCKNTPSAWKLQKNDPRWYKPRGVWQRNEGLDWLRRKYKNENHINAVVYFADDDNTYTMELFQEMRYTRRVSIWPVGLVGGVEVERPSVNKHGVVDGWDVGWNQQRPFATDMAGFAVHLQLFLNNPDVRWSEYSKRGHMESDLLEKLIRKEELEPKANNCKEVYVWHTQTVDPEIKHKSKPKLGVKKIEV